MKNKELIALLQQEDPELEVCVGSRDIYFIERLPAYYDGCLQRLIIDERKKPNYSIAGVKIMVSGDKLTLHTVSVEDVVYSHPDYPVDLSDLEEHAPVQFKDWTARIKEWRKEAKEIKARLDKKYP